MGQAISRRVVRGLERGMDRYRNELKDEALQEVAAKQRLAHQKGINFTDPNALQTGFTRGEGPWILPNETAQEEFLRDQQMQRQGGEKVELEPDLVKFLEDMGPLKKVVDPEFTSPRLLRHWKQQQDDADEEEEYQRQVEAGDEPVNAALHHPLAPVTSTGSSKLDRIPESERRTLQQMPLMENSGVTIARSTNFSTTVFAEDVSLGVTDLDLYGLLKKQEEQLQSQLSSKQRETKIASSSSSSSLPTSTTTTASVNAKPNLAAAFAAAAAVTAARQSKNMTVVQNELVSDFAKQFYQTVGSTEEDLANAQEEDTKRQALLRKTLQVLELPTIMKDGDGYYFGVWPDRVDDLQVTSQLVPVPEYKIKLVLADITDTEKQRQREEDQLQAPAQFSTRRRDRRLQDNR